MGLTYEKKNRERISHDILLRGQTLSSSHTSTICAKLSYFFLGVVGGGKGWDGSDSIVSAFGNIRRRRRFAFLFLRSVLTSFWPATSACALANWAGAIEALVEKQISSLDLVNYSASLFVLLNYLSIRNATRKWCVQQFQKLMFLVNFWV